MLATIVSDSGPEAQQFRVEIQTKVDETVPCYGPVCDWWDASRR